MKTTLQTLLIVAVLLIHTTIVNGQYTYQTAKRFAFGNSVSVFPDSNIILQPGVDVGNAIITTQPVWLLLGACGSSNNVYLQITGFGIGPSFSDTLSLVLYGPFSDTLNLASKLINANIDTVCNLKGMASLNGIILNPFSYHKGDIYMALVMSNIGLGNIYVSAGSTIFESDTAYCTLCNGQISDLYQPICTLTYDSASQKNKIVWTKDIFTPAQDYVFFRKNAAGTFDTLAYQSISQLSEYIDMTSSPLAKSQTYRVGIRDSCGQIMDRNSIGSYANNGFSTIHLIAYPTGPNSSGLIWNQGSFYNLPYLIYRTDPSGLTTLIDSLPYVNNQQTYTYTDVNAPAGLCSYQIGVNVTPSCVASLLPTYSIVKSNPGYVTVTGINDLTDLSAAVTVQPNPFNQFTKVDLHLITKNDLKVVLRNLTGQTVAHYDDVKTDELIIEKNNLPKGIYMLEVTGKDFFARKKLVIE